MSPDTLFTIASNGVLPAWLLLALAPRWEWTQRIVHGIWIPLLLGLVYAFALFSGGEQPEGGGFGSLQGVMILFTSPWGVLTGWVHYLVFDLFVGAWEVRDAGRNGIPHLWVLPCLFFTLMLGPIGLFLYLGLRFARLRITTLDESAA